MDWQQWVSLSIVGIAAGLLLRSRITPRTFRLERDTHCGCSASRDVPQYSVVFRTRKGERTQVLVKMK
jgi:hypothetical protein